jgi:hypothetical protein
MALDMLGKPGGKPATEVQDPGFFHPLSWLLPRFQIWVKSGFIVFSNGKPYDEQSERLLSDYHMLLKMLNGWLERLK